MQHAASLILVRQRNELEVFWVRRRAETSFLSRFHAFPGGLVEEQDWKQENEIGAALEAAVTRETMEEVNIDLSGEPLEYLGQWVAPPYLVKKFNTHYFLYRSEDLAPVVTPKNDELDAGEWIRPSDALERWVAGEVLLAPPTRAILEALSAGGITWDFSCFESAEAAGEEPTLSPIRSNLMMLPLRTPTLPPATHTNCYVLGTKTLLVVEPASPDRKVMEDLFSYLDTRIEAGATLKAVLLTHHHHDHIGGVTAMLSRYDVPVWAHRETAKRVPFAIHRTLEDGDVIESDPGAQWRVIHTPGHAPGHLCFIHEHTKSMVVGDMVAGLGSILVDPADGDMTLYLESLGRMREYQPSCLLPSHGPPIGGADVKLAQYIDHRLERERCLIAALKSGRTSMSSLVDFVYVDVPKQLKSGPNGGLAGISLRSHLDKLEAEGLVHLKGDNWIWCDREPNRQA